MEEVWKDIKGFEGIYQVSNLGRVKSLARVINNNGGKMMKPERIRKQQLTTKGYLSVSISCDRKKKKYQVHRLVAQAFISNPENKETVNHKNGIKTDNRVENLEWATQKENVVHSWKNGLAKMTENKLKTCKENGIKMGKINVMKMLKNRPKQKKGKENPRSRAVIQYDKEMNKIAEYDSIKEVQTVYGYDDSFVGGCCRGKYKTAYGYIWKFKN